MDEMLLCSVCFFSLMWSVGGTDSDDDRNLLNYFLKVFMNDTDIISTNEEFKGVFTLLQLRNWTFPEECAQIRGTLISILPNFDKQSSFFDYVFLTERYLSDYSDPSVLSPGWINWRDSFKVQEIPLDSSFSSIVVETTITKQIEH